MLLLMILRFPDLCPFICIVSHDEAEQEPRHDDVPESEHGEVSGRVTRREDQLPGQRESGRVSRQVSAQVKPPGHGTHGVVRWSGRNLEFNKDFASLSNKLKSLLLLTLTMTLALKTYCEKKTQKTS